MLIPTLTTTSISGVQFSSVVPGVVTGGDKVDHKLTNMDLAFKLHYIRGVYFFSAEAVQGLSIYELKKPMFPWLALSYTISGRIRRSETDVGGGGSGGGRPFIKCNDGGVRIIEAFCDKTIEEWMAISTDHDHSRFLAHDQVLGPDLGFSPLVYIQFTWFKCGGMSVGLSWAHVLGDPFSASTFINMWGQFMQGQVPAKSLHVPNTKKPECPPSTIGKPFSIKRVDPVGDYWVTNNNCKMETHSFHFTAEQLDNIVSNISGLALQPVKFSKFEIISAIIWKSLSKIRGDSEPRIVTICTRNCCKIDHEIPSNNLVFSIVRADFSTAKGDVHELAGLIAEKKEEENSLIEEIVGSDNGDNFDYIAYGTNLTFVNFEEADIYGLELKGNKPIFACYTIKGVGDEGAVLVLSRPKSGSDKGGGGRTVTVILPENQLVELKNELRKEWEIV